MPKIKTVRGIENRKVVSQKEWLVARKKLLVKEKKFSKLRDELNLQRRKLPWVKLEKDYVFDGPEGKETLAKLFGDKSQLIVYHFMFGPGWKEGCEHCSFWADHFDSVNVHIGRRDTTFVVISRAPLKEIEPFKKRMDWRFKWVSSFDTDFNFDFHVSFTPEQVKSGVLPYNYGKYKAKLDEKEGASAFYRDKNGDIYHTYLLSSRQDIIEQIRRPSREAFAKAEQTFRQGIVAAADGTVAPVPLLGGTKIQIGVVLVSNRGDVVDLVTRVFETELSSGASTAGEFFASLRTPLIDCQPFSPLRPKAEPRL